MSSIDFSNSEVAWLFDRLIECGWSPALLSEIAASRPETTDTEQADEIAVLKARVAALEGERALLITDLEKEVKENTRLLGIIQIYKTWLQPLIDIWEDESEEATDEPK